MRRPLFGIRSCANELIEAVRDELSGSGAGVGYLRMHRSILSKGFICKRNYVRIVMQQLDPEGVQLRRKRRLHRRKYFSQGPNYIWHIDDHDKLKPYGFSIHGCIEVGPANKKPEVVARYYIKSRLKINGKTENFARNLFLKAEKQLQNNFKTILGIRYPCYVIDCNVTHS